MYRRPSVPQEMALHWGNDGRVRKIKFMACGTDRRVNIPSLSEKPNVGGRQLWPWTAAEISGGGFNIVMR